VNTFFICLIVGVVILTLAYILTVVIPLLGVIAGLGKICLPVKKGIVREKEGERRINFSQDLGFTMADGGPAEEGEKRGE